MAEAGESDHGDKERRRVFVREVAGRPLGGRALVGGDPLDRDLGLVGEPAGAQRLDHGQVGVGRARQEGAVAVGVVVMEVSKTR